VEIADLQLSRQEATGPWLSPPSRLTLLINYLLIDVLAASSLITGLINELATFETHSSIKARSYNGSGSVGGSSSGSTTTTCCHISGVGLSAVRSGARKCCGTSLLLLLLLLLLMLLLLPTCCAGSFAAGSPRSVGSKRGPGKLLRRSPLILCLSSRSCHQI
jgi:hypothetical protein